MNTETEKPEDDIERLLKIAGHPEKPDEMTKQRAKADLRAAWQEGVAEHKAKRWKMRGVPVAIAATMLLAITAIIAVVPGTQTPQALATIVKHTGEYVVESEKSDQSKSVFAGDLLVTQSNGTLTLKLAGATYLHMDKSSHVTFKGSHEMWLHTGRVYVDSEGLNQPLTVHTTWGTIRDIGTQFELHIEDDTLKVAMREGAVEVEVAGSTEPLTATVNNAEGDVLLIDGDLDVLRSSVATTSPHWDWARAGAPAYPAGKNSLAHVLKWVARQTGRSIVFEQSITELRTKNEVVDWPEILVVDAEQALMQLVDTTSDFTVSFTPKKLVVSHRN